MSIVLDDPGEFCQKRQKCEGRIEVANLERLLAVCTSPSAELEWAAEGKFTPAGYPQLELTVKGRIDLTCQRCLDVFSFDLDSRAVIILARSETEANEIEDGLDDNDPMEVIVGDRNLDILALVEDEVLLTIPLSPRHDICPDTGRFVFGEKQASPFSVLQGLKTGKGKS